MSNIQLSPLSESLYHSLTSLKCFDCGEEGVVAVSLIMKAVFCGDCHLIHRRGSWSPDVKSISNNWYSDVELVVLQVLVDNPTVTDEILAESEPYLYSLKGADRQYIYPVADLEPYLVAINHYILKTVKQDFEQRGGCAESTNESVVECNQHLVDRLEQCLTNQLKYRRQQSADEMAKYRADPAGYHNEAKHRHEVELQADLQRRQQEQLQEQLEETQRERKQIGKAVLGTAVFCLSAAIYLFGC